MPSVVDSTAGPLGRHAVRDHMGGVVRCGRKQTSARALVRGFDAPPPLSHAVLDVQEDSVGDAAVLGIPNERPSAELDCAYPRIVMGPVGTRAPVAFPELEISEFVE